MRILLQKSSTAEWLSHIKMPTEVEICWLVFNDTVLSHISAEDCTLVELSIFTAWADKLFFHCDSILCNLIQCYWLYGIWQRTLHFKLLTRWKEDRNECIIMACCGRRQDMSYKNPPRWWIILPSGKREWETDTNNDNERVAAKKVQRE